MISRDQPPELYVATKSSAYFIVEGEIVGCHVDSSGRPMWDDLFTSMPPDVDKSLMVAILQFLTQQAVIEREAREGIRLVSRKD